MKSRYRPTTNIQSAIVRLLVLFAAILLTNIAASAAVFTVSNTNAFGPGSLPQAILDANSNPGLDTIAFNIPGSGFHSISPTSTLPTISDPVVIDGTTQPGFAGAPLIVVNGSNTTNSLGLRITAGNSTVRGLVINGFMFQAINIDTNGNNVIAGNYIGTNAAGTGPVPSPNDNIGVYVKSANNVIGGMTAADRNVISGNNAPNGGAGIWIDSIAATGNKVIGNYIGTDASGMTSVANANVGIILNNCSSNIIGGTTPGERNVISGNSYGIRIGGAAANNQVLGNYFGTKANGAASISNGTAISIVNAASNNTIGGSGPGTGNVIAYNSGRGIEAGYSGINNAILGNSIFSNGYGSYLGIDLFIGSFGVTSNDNNTGDADTGPNNLQNFPVLTGVAASGGTTTVQGTLDSAFSTQFRIEFFSNTACDTSGFGEGEKFLGFTNVTTDASGKANFTFNVPTASVVGNFFSATATDPQGSTSEFSACASGVVSSPGTLQLSTDFVSKFENAGSFTVDVTRTSGSVGTVTVSYATTDGTAIAPADYAATSGTLTFNDGEMSKTITVPIIDDNIPEGTENFTLTLSNPTGGAVLGNITTATLSMQDNDLPSLSVNNVSIVEGNAGNSNATFTVTLSDPITENVIVKYVTADGTGTMGSDYQPAGGTLTFSAGQTQKTINVLVNGDTQSEPDETFFINLSNSENATIAKSQGLGTIINDDGAAPATVQFSAADYSVQEDLTAATITVTRSGDTSGTATVAYATSNPAGYTPCNAISGLASQNCDYITALGTLTFAPGENSKTFQVLINEDSYVEGSEIVNLTLSDPSGASLGGQSTAVLTINDDAVEAVANPNDDAQNFVHQHYHDFLNREPDQGGLAYWTSQITQCGSDADCLNGRRRDVSAAYYVEQEFQVTGSFVYRLYKASYGSLPAYAQFVADRSRVSSGADLEQSKQAFADGWVTRPAFLQLYPQGMTA
ncbi:MAG TPA: Calx-beta domain-containing protein, partial [Pyrinomonadaceae bacterium]|nr:Calx-beta domain-containing protein [Pyrinomonadaceae bacterium]